MNETAPRPQADPSAFRLLRHPPDGHIQVGGLELLQGEGLLWLDLKGQREPEMDLLARTFGLHPLEVEDCLHLDQRPKLEGYDGHLFVVQHTFTVGAHAKDLELHEIHAVLGNGWLLTIHADPVPLLDAVFARASRDANLTAHGADFLLYLISDAVVDGHYRVLEGLTEEVDALQDEVFRQPSRSSIESIFELKGALLTLRRTVAPSREVMANLAREPGVGERASLYLRDVHDHLVRLTESLDASRELRGSALDAYLSMAANRTNDIVKQLTIFSVTFLPLSFVTGFFGQNFTSMPFDQRWLFYLMMGLCAAVPLSMLVWFRRKRWL